MLLADAGQDFREIYYVSSSEPFDRIIIIHGLPDAGEPLSCDGSIIDMHAGASGGARGTSKGHGPPYAMVHHEKKYG
jgi:hypothetical protein